MKRNTHTRTRTHTYMHRHANTHTHYEESENEMVNHIKKDRDVEEKAHTHSLT